MVPYYVGFKVGNQDIGHNDEVTAFYHVDDIKKNLKSLVDAGAKIIQEIKDIGESTFLHRRSNS
jgi:predicted enzyme related to lactoylglutathione lyase